MARLFSGVFHPLFMVTYGIGLSLLGTYLGMYPLHLKILLLVSAFICTAFIPALCIALLMRIGIVSETSILDRKERHLPYLFSIVSVVGYSYFLYRLSMPFWISSIIALGVGVTLTICSLVNIFWKISIHAAGVGGLLGGVMAVSSIQRTNPYFLFMLILFFAGCTISARLFLKKHTPAQVYAGFSLGFICLFVATYWSFIP